MCVKSTEIQALLMERGYEGIAKAGIDREQLLFDAYLPSEFIENYLHSSLSKAEIEHFVEVIGDQMAEFVTYVDGREELTLEGNPMDVNRDPVLLKVREILATKVRTDKLDILRLMKSADDARC